MRTEARIVLTWALLLVSLRLLMLFPHGYFEPMGMINASLQLLLCILSIQIARGSQGSQRFIFINFAFYFGFVLFLQASPFVGRSLFPDTKFPYASIYYRFYVSKFGLNYLMLFVPLYIAVDYFWRRLTQPIKYVMSAALTICILSIWFVPTLFSPLDLYSRDDFVALRALKKAQQEWRSQHDYDAKDEDLAAALLGGQPTSDGKGQLESVLRKTQILRPYLKEGGEVEIFWKPIHIAGLFINLIGILIITLMLYCFYKYNKPYYAYMDKLLILLLLSSAIEMVHIYGSIRSVSLENYYMIFKIGQYFTVALFVVMVYAFDLKLRFVLSPAGNYYERVIGESPASLTRWRDEIDTIILKVFAKGSLHWNNIAFRDLNKNKTKGTLQ